MLEIKCFTFGPFETNTYVVTLPLREGQGGGCLLIDPACFDEREKQQLLDYINSLAPLNSHLSIIATHGHLDHLWGAKWATEKWGVPVLIHEADIPMAQAMQQQYNLFGIRATAQPFPMEIIQSPMSNLQVLHTPGHTPGSISLYWPEEKILFSGDTLFRMGYGRTDLPGGDIGALIQSLNRLFTLPNDVRVYPGHGESTTIGAEKR